MLLDLNLPLTLNINSHEHFSVFSNVFSDIAISSVLWFFLHASMNSEIHKNNCSHCDHWNSGFFRTRKRKISLYFISKVQKAGKPPFDRRKFGTKPYLCNMKVFIFQSKKCEFLNLLAVCLSFKAPKMRR